MFPDDRTPNLLFNGVPFNKVPICHVQVKKNNAKFRINDADSTFLNILSFEDTVEFFCSRRVNSF